MRCTLFSHKPQYRELEEHRHYLYKIRDQTAFRLGIPNTIEDWKKMTKAVQLLMLSKGFFHHGKKVNKIINGRS